MIYSSDNLGVVHNLEVTDYFGVVYVDDLRWIDPRVMSLVFAKSFI